MNPNPIGVFDSGIGGLTIWKEINELLPFESTIYLADSANAPYGERSPEAILELSRANTRRLMDLGCKLIVVACNTATTNAIEELRAEFSVPFIGIEPAIKPAGLQSRSGTIGVLATRGTLASSLFSKTARTYLKDIQIIQQYGDGLVPLIESDQIESDTMTLLLNRYLQPMIRSGADHVVLGCTHYPLLTERIKRIMPEGITIVDSGKPVARQTLNVLRSYDLLSGLSNEPVHRFLTSGDPVLLKRFLLRFERHEDPQLVVTSV
ncbi:glutamate racemase [Robertkochia aurantiaca]|uniref:glutamate racemase n=1 Tax=Robertkochia aurantiaca TaxID=2873700 RepID=UPI001CCA7769|nr:glutamate racemase [Robertkochia sp. 3YJGBD-33]